MSDRATVLLAALAWLGAAIGLRTGLGPPVVAAALAVLAALALRRPPLLLVVIALLTSARAASDVRGLEHPAVGRVQGWATLVTDPEIRGPDATRVEVKLASDHLLATAHGHDANLLAERSAGERVLLSGHATRAPPRASWLVRRHIAGQLAIDEVRGVDEGSTVVRVANQLRGVLERSAEGLPPTQRGLYLGFVLGDDRDQEAAVVDDFRGSGLSHLLVVSGQNVAFSLALATPALRVLGLRSRWVATIAVIAMFAVIARFEPSVLRASAMAGLAATASMLGRQASGMRLLALAVTALLVLDPFLVDSVGFELSVAASAAIVVGSRPLADWLPGPRPIAVALAVSIAAQVGVAPVLIATFGGAPVAGVLANLLAAPAAGPVMVWGVAAGLVSGTVGSPLATVLHAPTRLLIGWIAFVAERAARWPFGDVRGGELLALGAGVVLLGIGARASARLVRAAGGIVLAMALVAPGIAGVMTPIEHLRVGGVSLWREGNVSVLVVADPSVPTDVLAALRMAGVARVDLVVLATPNVDDVLDAVAARAEVDAVIRPQDIDVPTALRLGPLEISVEPSARGLLVVVQSGDAASGGRDPPV